MIDACKFFKKKKKKENMHFPLKFQLKRRNMKWLIENWKKTWNITFNMGCLSLVYDYSLPPLLLKRKKRRNHLIGWLPKLGFPKIVAHLLLTLISTNVLKFLRLMKYNTRPCLVLRFSYCCKRGRLSSGKYFSKKLLHLFTQPTLGYSFCWWIFP